MAGAQKRVSYFFILYLLFSMLLLLLDSKGSLSFLHKGAQAITSPFKSALFSGRLTVLSPFIVIGNSGKKEAEIEKLQQEKADALSQLSALTAAKEENERMRYLLGTTLPPSWHFAPLRVVGKIGDTLITAGDLPAEAGEPVIATPGTESAGRRRSGVFIGKVGGTVGREIKVILPTSTSSKIPVIVRAPDGARRASGILVGKGESMRIEQVLSSETLSEGDLVLTSGEGAPPELLIGYVSKILPQEASAWKSAEVKTAMDVEDLDFVFVITKF
ncbi:MAG: rod shape-determining protein MreC [bacterium]|nr:rod shape-determining protein MreC [bacterium]